MAKRPVSLSALAWRICVVTVASCTWGCGSGGGGVDADDDRRPSQVNDLRVESVTKNTVTLAWTAPGDDDTVGTAAAYDVRASKDVITWQDWDAAYPLSGEPKPSPYGSTDTMVVTGLEEDSTYYFALKTKGHNGEWSWISNCVTAVCFDDFEVVFPDPELDGAIRAIIGLPTGPIRRSHLVGLDFLDLNDKGISDLTGLEYCVKLRAIFMGQNDVSDLSPLAGLVEMTHLQIANNRVSDISPLSGLLELRQIVLNRNSVADISPLAGLANLVDLQLADNEIADVTPLQGLVNLYVVILSGNRVVDIAPLVANPGLAAGDVVYLVGNPLSDESIAVHIPALVARGVIVHH